LRSGLVLRVHVGTIMSEKPSQRPAASKASAKTEGNAAPADGKTSADKSRIDDESYDFLSPPQSPGELGRLEHYRVLKLLGKGGMGMVFMAEDTLLHRTVALKVMLPSMAKKAIAKDRFIREARATAKIEHDHIVTIYQVSREDSAVPYLAMQFLRGMTLEDWLKAGKTFNIPQIMRIGKEIAKGLAAAHAQHLIHRDIKPSNVWLDAANKGRVKILDFGLARPIHEETHLTQEGMILGSPAYMSPEQARGQDVDERCDLFSLGCVMYRLCAGKLPFAGKDAMSMLLAITSEEPAALTKLNSELQKALAELIHKLLAKDPKDRPASAKEVVQTIQGIEREWVADAKTAAHRPVTPAPATNRDDTIAASEAIDPALEESAITDLELQATDLPAAKQAAPPARPGSWVFTGLGCTAAVIVSLMCCVAFLAFTNVGHVELDADETMTALLKQAGGLLVRDESEKAHAILPGEPVQLAAGTYRVDDSDAMKGFHAEPSPFTIQRGETVKLKVTAAIPPAPPKFVKPDVVEVTSSDHAKALQKEWSAYLKRDIVEKNSLDAKLVLIPPGEFMMGTSKEYLKSHTADVIAKKLEKKGILDGYIARLAFESPQHKVKISRPFYIGATEVTHGQFVRYMAAQKTPITVPERTGLGGTGIEKGRIVERDRKYTWQDSGYKPTTISPVNNIAWEDAEAFCKWLSKREKKTYRLPTEAEWEYACRAGTSSLWTFGNDLYVESRSREYMWFHVPLIKPDFPKNPLTPGEVAKKKPNDFGLFDMHGNVAEMCSDNWDPRYYARSLKDGIAIDPQGPPAAPITMRVVRGGAFFETAYVARSAYRSPLDPNHGYVHVGFRVVCEIETPKE